MALRPMLRSAVVVLRFDEEIWSSLRLDVGTVCGWTRHGVHQDQEFPVLVGSSVLHLCFALCHGHPDYRLWVCGPGSGVSTADCGFRQMADSPPHSPVPLPVQNMQNYYGNAMTMARMRHRERESE